MQRSLSRICGVSLVVTSTIVTPFGVVAQRTLSYTEADYSYRNGVEAVRKK